jgi:hypothetical protein
MFNSKLMDALRGLVVASCTTEEVRATSAFKAAEELVAADNKARLDRVEKRQAEIKDQLSCPDSWAGSIRVKMLATGKSSLTCSELGWDCSNHTCLCAEGGIVWDCGCGRLQTPNSPCSCECEE